MSYITFSSIATFILVPFTPRSLRVACITHAHVLSLSIYRVFFFGNSVSNSSCHIENIVVLSSLNIHFANLDTAGMTGSSKTVFANTLKTTANWLTTFVAKLKLHSA